MEQEYNDEIVTAGQRGKMLNARYGAVEVLVLRFGGSEQEHAKTARPSEWYLDVMRLESGFCVANAVISMAWTFGGGATNRAVRVAG